MILDTDIIPFSTNSYRVYKSTDDYFMINGEYDLLSEFQLDESSSEEELEQYQDQYEQLEEKFRTYYEENQASCHHFIGEFRIDSQNYSPFVGSFYGFDYFSESQIKEVLSKLIHCIASQSSESLKEYQIKVATLYDLESLDNLEPDRYQLHEYLEDDLKQ